MLITYANQRNPVRILRVVTVLEPRTPQQRQGNGRQDRVELCEWLLPSHNGYLNQSIRVGLAGRPRAPRLARDRDDVWRFSIPARLCIAYPVLSIPLDVLRYRLMFGGSDELPQGWISCESLISRIFSDPVRHRLRRCQ